MGQSADEAGMPDYLDSSDRILFHRSLTKKRKPATSARSIRLIGFSGQRDPKMASTARSEYKKAGRYAAHPALGRIG
jgi:hypothetical protein